MHTANVPTTLPVLAAARYPCCTLSENATPPITNTPPITAYLIIFRDPFGPECPRALFDALGENDDGAFVE